MYFGTRTVYTWCACYKYKYNDKFKYDGIFTSFRDWRRCSR